MYQSRNLIYDKFESKIIKLFGNDEKKYYLQYVRNYLKGNFNKFNKNWFEFTTPYFLDDCYLCNSCGIMEKIIEKHTITLFEYSILRGDINLFNIILMEINVNMLNKNKTCKPLEYAIYQNNIYMFKELIKKGAKLNNLCIVYTKYIKIEKFMEEFRPHLSNSLK